MFVAAGRIILGKIISHTFIFVDPIPLMREVELASVDIGEDKLVVLKGILVLIIPFGSPDPQHHLVDAIFTRLPVID
jgi:hypothetical protein